MRILTLAAIAALGLTAACTDRDDYAATDDQAATTEYGADAAADAAASAAAAADAARDAADSTVTTRTVVVPDPDDDNVNVQVGPDGARVNATIDTD